jgi:hypothetical protein
MLPSYEMMLAGALGQQDARYEAYFDLVTHQDAQAFEHRRCDESRGAKLGANDPNYQATPGHIRPLQPRRNGTSGHIQHYQATFRN